MTTGRNIKCPQCGKETEYSASNPSRPFCSERCRLLDLGQWAEEKYRIPTETPPDEVNEKNPEEDDDSDISGAPAGQPLH